MGHSKKFQGQTHQKNLYKIGNIIFIELRTILLLTLVIKNFTLVEHLEIDFSSGMTALTGETGAGKSLIVGALAMALGDRADIDQLRRSADRAEVAALFDISKVIQAKKWLEKNDFNNTEDGCLLRRVLTREGRSRGHINGQLATMQQLRELGETLIDIHNQHEHQSLLRRETHRYILDDFAGCSVLSKTTQKLFYRWIDAQKRLGELKNISSELLASRDFLSFQLAELEEVKISEGELQSLEQEQIRLANAESIITDCNTILQLCSEGENFNLEKNINETIQVLNKIPAKPDALKEAERLLLSAQIEIQESGKEIQQYLNGFNAEPEILKKTEDRLSEIYHLARKYKITPEELHLKCIKLKEELKQLSMSHDEEKILEQQVKDLYERYMVEAKKLSKIRASASKKITASIQKQFKLLSMAGAQFTVSLTPIVQDKFGSHGQENIEFLISTNPGEPCKPLARIASGGELSRISLAIQAIAAQYSSIPTLVFDEVDVGIGGATADIVGSILRELGNQGQILCITHQPQVAAQAHNHMLVSKNTKKSITYSKIISLRAADKVNEIARMLGGVCITDATLSHAKEMINLSEKKSTK